MTGSRLAIHEPAAQGLRRLLRLELELAAAALGERSAETTGAVVHGVRKHLKIARTIVRLLGPHLGTTRAPLADALRAAARSLAGPRDAAVLAETAATLAARFKPGPKRDLLAAVAAAAAQEAAAAADPTMSHEAERRLAEALRLVASLPVTEEAAVGPRIASLYRKARRLWRRAGADRASPEDLHAWRKRVKDRIAVARFFNGRWPEADGVKARRLERAADALGRHQDLSVLLERLPADDPATKAVRRAVIGRQRRLAARAVALAAPAFEVKPKAVRAAWEGV